MQVGCRAISYIVFSRKWPNS